MKKKFLPLLLLTALVLSGCSGGSDASSDASGTADEPQQEVKQYAVGETGTGAHYNITLVGGETSDEVPIGDTMSYFPDDGNVFLLLGLRLENTTEEDQEAKMWSATVVVDGVETDTVSLSSEAEIQGQTYQRMSSDTVLAPGETMELYASTEVPETWQSCEFTYDGVTFVISADEATPPPPPPVPEYGIGEAAQTENFSVTLVMGESMKQVEEYSTSSFYRYSEAGEGNTLLVLLFDIQNTTDETQQLFEGDNFDLTVDGEKYTLTWLMMMSNISINDTPYEGFATSMYPDFELESGAEEIRYIVAEIPEDWDHFEITFDGAIFKGDQNSADISGEGAEDDTEIIEETDE